MLKTPQSSASKNPLKTIDFYALYDISCQKLKKSKELSLKTIQRAIRPSCKTTLMNNKCLCFRLKNTNINVMVYRNSMNYIDGVYYFRVSSCNLSRNFELEISASTNFELMDKINNSYHFLKPLKNAN